MPLIEELKESDNKENVEVKNEPKSVKIDTWDDISSLSSASSASVVSNSQKTEPANSPKPKSASQYSGPRFVHILNISFFRVLSNN